MSKHIRILQSYKRQTDGQLIAAAGAVIQGMTGNAAFPSPPVDLKTAQAAADEFSAAAAAQVQGGTAATAIKKTRRAALIAILAKLAHYVQDNCDEDPAAVVRAGFTIVSFGRTPSLLEKPVIAGIDFGKTTQLVVKINRVVRAKCYELRYAAIGVGGAPDAWQNAGLFTNSRSMTVNGLTPGTTYAFQVRAVGSAGLTDWSDSVAHVSL
jgi:fibronectin type III domain protein